MSLAEELKNLTLTENNAIAFKSTKNSALDLFYTIGASRGKVILPLFESSFVQSPHLSVRIALWARDISACGERQVFRDILKYIESKDIELFKRIVLKVPKIGRWDDLLVAETDEGFKFVANLIKKEIDESSAKGNSCSLAAKWMPRQGKMAIKLRKAFEMTPKKYRKFLVKNTQVVENLMCKKDFNSIDFNAVPSLAMARYTNAFKKNAKDKFKEYKESLLNSSEKAKTFTLYPYDVIKTLKNGDQDMAEIQWRDLKSFVTDCNILPLVDVSGSMVQPIGKSVTAMDVSLSMGIYLSERQLGSFKDLVLTFDSTPSFVDLSKCKNLIDKCQTLLNAPWGCSTNVIAAFEAILNMALKLKVPQSDMPDALIILSDMEFDSACDNHHDTVYESCQKKFEKNGYKLPTIVFWNLVSRNQHMPVKFDTKGTILLSGLSPIIFKDVLEDINNSNPVDVMMKVISDPKYDF